MTASLERKRVEMEEEVKLLSLQKTVAATDAECRVWESEADDESVHSSERQKLDGAVDPVGDTARFVSQQSEVRTSFLLPSQCCTSTGSKCRRDEFTTRTSF
jgi:hypothetical protein